jgi:serine/threonine protein kinase
MDATTNRPDTEGWRPHVQGSSGASDETTGLPETKGAQPLIDESPGGSTIGDPPKLGRYRIIRRSGEGGFGRVYLAQNLRNCVVS